jgi:hypothetical protein
LQSNWKRRGRLQATDNRNVARELKIAQIEWRKSDDAEWRMLTGHIAALLRSQIFLTGFPGASPIAARAAGPAPNVRRSAQAITEARSG